MSFRAVEAVLEHSRSRGSDRLVLVVIAECANHDGEEAWPSVPTIARRAGVDRATVYRCIRRLVDLGELRVDSQSGPNGSNRYAVAVGGVAGCDGSQDATGRNSSLGGSQDATGGVAQVRPEPSEEPSKEPPTALRARGRGGEARLFAVPGGTAPAREPRKVGGRDVTDREHDLVDGILAAFNAAAGSRFGAVDFRAKIVRRLRERPELTLDQHEEVIARNFRAPWWKDEPTPSVLYGNSAIFERALACRGTPPAKGVRDRQIAEGDALARRGLAALNRLTGRDRDGDG